MLDRPPRQLGAPAHPGLLADAREVVLDGAHRDVELFADLAIIHAYKADTEGNLVYRKTARNFNPVMATAAKVTVAEVEHLVEPGEIDPDNIMTSGVFVTRIVKLERADKRIEQRTVRKRAEMTPATASEFEPSAA